MPGHGDAPSGENPPTFSLLFSSSMGQQATGIEREGLAAHRPAQVLVGPPTLSSKTAPFPKPLFLHSVDTNSTGRKEQESCSHFTDKETDQRKDVWLFFFFFF